MQQKNNGFIFVYTGEGSGLSAATMGHALRAMAAGQRVFIAQFDRWGWDPVLNLIRRISDAIVCRRYTKGERFIGEPDRDEIRNARQGLNEVGQALRSGDYSPVILDGANRAVCFGLFSVTDLLVLIEQKPQNGQWVITGACADPRIIQRADQVIEVNSLKRTPQAFSPYAGKR